VVDKFPVKRIIFLTTILSSGFAAFAFNFVQELPAKNTVRLSCDTTVSVIDVCSYNDDSNNLQLRQCDDGLSAILEMITEPVQCQVSYKL